MQCCCFLVNMTLKINFSRPASALFEKHEKIGEKGVLGEASVTLWA